MSSPHADDVFTIRFDDAVESMHQHSYRGSRPTAGLWNDIRSQMHPENGAMAAPNPTPEHVAPRRRSSMISPQANVAGPRSGSRTPRRNASAWIALALVMMLVASGLYLNQALQRDTSDQQIAWAPGTTISNPNDEIMVASPPASPSAIEYGPEFACTVEPLTVDIVLDMVINPNRELQRRGAEYSSAELEKPAEIANETNTWNYVFDAKDLFGSSNDATQLESITNSANQFWNCLMTGTAYQVWALMYPSTVQHEILKYFPVFRDEAGLRRHIEKWGPQAYNARHYLSFPNLGGQDPVRASMHVDESPGSTTVSYTASPYDPESAIVLMIPHPDSNSSPLNYRELLLRKASDGTWWVVAINYPDNLRGKG